MSNFQSLRREARIVRDATIDQARRDCRTALNAINAFQRSIVAKPPHPRQPARPNDTNSITRREAIVEVLGRRSLTKIEFAVGVVERGYVTLMPRADLVRYVASLLKRDKRFEMAGGKWRIDEASQASGNPGRLTR